MKLIRLQDNTGRGPWRPGFSKYWMSENNPYIGKPIQEDFKNVGKIIKRAHDKGLHVGCAVRGSKSKLWFTDEELEKLKGFGFYFVDCTKCDVLAESDTQALIGSKFPLKFLERV